MHFSSSVENENLLYWTDTCTFQFFGDHSTVTVCPDVRHVWVEPTPQLLTEEISNWEKAVNVMPSTIPAYEISKKNIISDVGTSPGPGEKIVYSLHGGAYIRLRQALTMFPANIGRGLLEHCVEVCHVFAIEYRLQTHTRRAFAPIPCVPV
jgi:hypothetical protein